MAKGKRTGGKQDIGNEPVLIIRPAINRLGLDYLHITLIALVLVLIGVAVSLSSFKQGVLVQNCTYVAGQNSMCVSPAHTGNEALVAAEQVIASYSTINSSLSLLPYYSMPDRANASFVPAQREWLVTVPYLDPLLHNQTFVTSLLIYDSNLSLAQPFQQSAPPVTYTKNQAVALGVVEDYGKTACSGTGPFPVYAFIDPYAPGAVPGMYSAVNASREYPGAINISYKFVSTLYEAGYYGSYGAGYTLAMNSNLWCASRQPAMFPAFLHNFSLLYSGQPISNTTLASIAQGSGLNMSKYRLCLQNSTTVIAHQDQLAEFYNIGTTPAFVVNCRYETIPELLGRAIGYAYNQTARPK